MLVSSAGIVSGQSETPHQASALPCLFPPSSYVELIEVSAEWNNLTATPSVKLTVLPEAVANDAEETYAEVTSMRAEVSTDDGSTRKTLGYVSLAVGGAGLIAGTAFGFAARSTRDDLTAACIDDVCSESQRETYDRGKMQANISTAGFLIGGVGIGLGAVLLLTGPKDQEKEAAEAKVQPYVGPLSAGVQGRF